MRKNLLGSKKEKKKNWKKNKQTSYTAGKTKLEPTSVGLEWL